MLCQFYLNKPVAEKNAEKNAVTHMYKFNFLS